VRDSRAVLAFVFGLVGGALILTSLVVLYPSYFGYGYGFGGFLGPFGFFTAISSGVIVILAAVLTFRVPAHGVTWGTVMIVFGSMSALGLGGFFIGMALSITGGALAIVAGAMTGAPESVVVGIRACTSCGMLFQMDFAHCPHCGHAVGGMKV